RCLGSFPPLRPLRQRSRSTLWERRKEAAARKGARGRTARPASAHRDLGARPALRTSAITSVFRRSSRNSMRDTGLDGVCVAEGLYLQVMMAFQELRWHDRCLYSAFAETGGDLVVSDGFCSWPE